MKLLWAFVAAYAVGVGLDLAFFGWLAWSSVDLFATPGTAPVATAEAEW